MKRKFIGKTLIALFLIALASFASVPAAEARTASPTGYLYNQKSGLAAFAVPSSWVVRNVRIISGSRPVVCGRSGPRRTPTAWCSMYRPAKRATGTRVRLRVQYERRIGKRWVRSIWSRILPVQAS